MAYFSSFSMPYSVSAEAIGHLGYHLRPPLVRGPQLIIIYYIILFSHLKKKRAHFSHLSDMKANVITKSLVCRRKDYKKPVSHLGKKKGLFLTLK